MDEPVRRLKTAAVEDTAVQVLNFELRYLDGDRLVLRRIAA
jgi:hypothetical protein